MPEQTPVSGIMADRGQDYVAAWPTRISRQIRLSPEYVAEALVRVGLTNRDEENALRAKFLTKEPTQQIGALTPDDARRIIAELRVISDEIREAATTHCHYCGLPLRADGECPSCGTVD